MSELTGEHLIAGAFSRRGEVAFQAEDPGTGARLEPGFAEAMPAEIEAACAAAAAAFAPYTRLDPATRASFLRRIGEQIEALGDTLLARAHAETGLPLPRLQGERGRTVAQLRMFADLVEEGSWVDARIDRAQPERAPSARPDLRRMLRPLGPVAVFGASNFPLAFSVAGGDTASALAAGCPVVVKAHPAHPGTSELVGRALAKAAADVGAPPGVFSLLQGATPAVGRGLVEHPAIRAVGFTGSHRAGRALFDAAARRPEPIPVFAEMGSTNPVLVTEAALQARAEAIARGLAASVTLGAGQFCTNPGLVLLVRSAAAERFLTALGEALAAAAPGTMVHAGIRESYEASLARRIGPGVRLAARATGPGRRAETDARATLLVTDAATFATRPELAEEVFGPATLVVQADDATGLLALLRELRGQLTATLHAEPGEPGLSELLAALAGRAGRVVMNGFPTGVEVVSAMHHGGPYPATTDARATSVGTAAILRFARPVCFQDVPDALLPVELQDANPRGVWRLLDGQLSRSRIG